MSEGLDVGTLTGRIELEDRLTNVLEQVGGAIGKFESSWKNAASHVLENAASFFTAEAALHAVEGALHAGIDTIKDLTIEGAKVADVERNFEHLMDTSGRLGATLLGTLREGTHNTISDFELMKAANQDLAAGLNLTDQQFGTLAKGAFALAQATGQDVKTAFETMNDAMLTGRTRALAMLTGTIDLSKAEEEYAKKIHVRVETLTEEEKLQAKREQILRAVGDATERLGEQTDGLDEKIDQAKASWANFTEELGKTVAESPVLLTAFDAIRDELINAFGGSQEELIHTIAKAIDDTAISALEFAKTIVDGIGIAGVEWNAFKVVVESVEQGFRAVGYTLGEVLLELMKVANFVTGGSISGAVKDMEKAVDELYDRMAEGQNKIEGYKKAEDEWAVTTGHVNEAIERVRERMVAAQKAQEDAAATTEQHSEKTKALAANTSEAAEAVGKLGNNTRLTKEEQKKFNEALEDMAVVGGKWRDTLAGIDGETVEAIKYYLEAGISLDKLQIAYSLTAAQAKAVESAWREGNEVMKTQIKAANELGDAWNEYYKRLAGLTGTDLDHANAASLDKYQQHIKMLQDMGVADSKYYDDAYNLYQADTKLNEKEILLKDTHSKAYLDQQLANAEQEYQFKLAHSDQYTQAEIKNTAMQVAALKQARDAWYENGQAIAENTDQVKLLSGEVVSYAEALKRLNSGGSFTYDLSTKAGIDQYRKMNPGAQINASDQQIIDFIKRGGTLQQLIQQGLINPYGNWGSGNGMPSFAEGGYGDFGAGTPAMLHGKEIITPVEKVGGLGGSTTLNFYVNGTAVQAAQQIKDIIMRELKTVRQFPSA